MNHALHGLGIGWRPEIALTIDRRTDLSFIEITAENHDPRHPIPPAIRALQERGLAVVPHGVSLSLGGADPIDRDRVKRLADLADALSAPLVSEHIAFVRAGDVEAGHLLPLPRTADALEVLVDNVLAAKEMLPVPLALENISTLFEWPDAQMDEAAFVRQAIERTDCLLLLDVANVWANCRNLGGEPSAFLRTLPLERLAYVHVGGGYERDGVYHDSHAHPVPQGVFDALADLASLAPDAIGVMLERDDHFPPPNELNRELDALSDAVVVGRMRRESDREKCHAEDREDGDT